MKSADAAIAESDVCPKGARRVEEDVHAKVSVYLYEDEVAFIVVRGVGVSRLSRAELGRMMTFGMGWEPITKVGA